MTDGARGKSLSVEHGLRTKMFGQIETFGGHRKFH